MRRLISQIPAEIEAGKPVSRDCRTINALIAWAKGAQREMERLRQDVENLRRDMPGAGGGSGTGGDARWS
jgi:hypothetical protein